MNIFYLHAEIDSITYVFMKTFRRTSIGLVAVACLYFLGCVTQQNRFAIMNSSQSPIDDSLTTKNIKASKNEPTAVTHPELREVLLEMIEEDQHWRHKIRNTRFSNTAVLDATSEVDARNMVRMKQIVDEYCWPTRRMVGRDGTHAAWLLIQHADRDPEFQLRCLDLMENHLEDGEVLKSDFAYLVDRVLVNNGKLQRFGTQFHKVDGKLTHQSMEDPAHVDERRVKFGLQSMADYKKLMET